LLTKRTFSLKKRPYHIDSDLDRKPFRSRRTSY